MKTVNEKSASIPKASGGKNVKRTSRKSYRERLVAIYEKHNPEKVRIPALFQLVPYFNQLNGGVWGGECPHVQYSVKHAGLLGRAPCDHVAPPRCMPLTIHYLRAFRLVGWVRQSWIRLMSFLRSTRGENVSCLRRWKTSMRSRKRMSCRTTLGPNDLRAVQGTWSPGAMSARAGHIRPSQIRVVHGSI